ncbi:MAG: long-chain fatty acid--CoA ligase [Myxococcota bacterium]
MRRAEIESEILEWIGETPWQEDQARFERLALALFRFQYDGCETYARFCQALERSPATVESFVDIPAVPTGAFKEFNLRCFESDDTIKTFRTSGTSGDRRGRLHLDTLEIYEASLLSSLRRNFLDDLRGQRPIMRFLAPSAVEASDSSLSHMFETLCRAEAGPGSGFDLRDERLDLEALAEAVHQAKRTGAPILVLGTSFAFVHFLDATVQADTADWQLPAGSRVMETGGFKGRSREVPAEMLRENLAKRFDIPETSVINQYGMTELGSQFYDSSWIDPTGPRRKIVPPWVRVRFIKPETGQDVEPGELGMIVIHDLANTGSVAAIQTADLGRSIGNEAGEILGFQVSGRFEGAEKRGCSIATDIMLDASSGTASG